MLDEYYAARGWDVPTGLPTPEKLDELDLGQDPPDGGTTSEEGHL